jgi:hypothetical protein
MFEINCLSAIKKNFERKSDENSKYFPASQIGDLNESHLDIKYKTKNPKFDSIKEEILRYFEPCELESNVNYSLIWNEVNSVSNLSIF